MLKKNKWIFIFTLISLISFDQWTKELALRFLSNGSIVELTPFCNLVLVFNKGISFGWLNASGILGTWLIIVATTLISFWLIFMIYKCSKKHEMYGYTLVLAGAIGNIIDRFMHKAVVDFIHFHYQSFSFPVFNGADSFITCGAVLIIAERLWHD